MSTQQDIYAAGSENRPPMLNKENYVPWSSRLLRYAKSRPNGKLIHNSILNGPYVRKLIPEPGEEGQVIQRMRKPEWSRHVTIVHQTKDLHTADYTQLYDFLKYNQKEVDELTAERIAKTHDPLALMANSNNPYVFLAPHQDQPSFNQNYLQQPMTNPKDITDPTTAMNMALTLMAKAFKLNYSTPTNNNQRISSNPRNRQIAQSGMNLGQDRQMQMVGGNGGNQFRQYVGQNAGNPTGYNDAIGNQVNQNAVQNPRVQNVRNQNGLIGVQGNRNQIGNGNLVVARAKGNAVGQNGNQIRCYNCRGKEEAGIQLQAEEYDLMVAAANLDEIEEVNANCILMVNLQQASTSGTQTDSAPVYDTDGSAEVHENCYNNEIFNMFTQEEQYTELLELILELHQVPQNDNDVISEDTSVEQGDENPIRTLADYSKPSHEGYKNTIELPVGNNMLDWLERLPAGSITTWEDLTTRFLAQFFLPRRTAKLCNDIMMFQQHHGEYTTKEELIIQKEEMELEKNGNSFKPVAETTKNDVGTSTTIIPGPVTIEEKAKKKNDVKVRSMLLMALPNAHLMTFNQYKDAKTLFAAIETRFGGNKATKKTQKTLLKQLYENFNDLEQIHKDDLEEMDLKWQLALLSMSAKRFFQKTGKKITINGNDIAGYDKSKVECFIFIRWGILQENAKCQGIKTGFDWSYMVDDEAHTNMAFMTLSDSEESDEEDEVESPLKKERKNVEPSVNKVEAEIPKQNDKPARRPFKYAEMYITKRPRG
uniref:Ribonuclease H-like domain-containing protein n=1 Tax=Tanacetum cinerariifolium TaxID=118510 RepID=A0A6L2N261_TANCI|nr:ribonuclease H-like domain-containing protein [Tanacetum cinerariifolium]